LAGLSPESREIEARLETIRRERRAPISFAWRDSLRDELADIVRSSASAGWDGYDAAPLSESAEVAALRLIEALPEAILVPDVTPEPSGDIVLEWRKGESKHFTLSLSGSKLVYAGIFGSSCKKYGEEPFFDVLPPTILGILGQHFPTD
jgi:hypothetical protein